MFERNLKDVIPSQLSQFPKIDSSEGDPYYFGRWDTDSDSGGALLRYWFWNREKNGKNPKKVLVREMDNLLRNSLRSGLVTRQDFKNCCPKTNESGGCGYAVIIGILEFLQVIRWSGEGVYEVVDQARLLRLLQ